jgi:hypothetical protein
MESPPSSSDALEQIRPRRWPVVVVLLAVVVLGVVAVVVIVGRVARAGIDKEARAWATLQRCLLGPDPIESGQPPSARIRHIQLSALGIPWRAKGQEAWPGWCSPRAHALHEALREAGHAQNGAKDLAYWSEHLGKELHDHPYPENEIGADVDALWGAGKAQGLPVSEADDVPATPAVAIPLTVDALEAVPPLASAAFPLDLVRDESVPSEAMRLTIVGSQVPRAPMLCTVLPAGEAVTCGTFPSALENVQARLLGGAEPEAVPLVFAAPAGEGGIFRGSDGSLFDEGVSYGGFVRADGFAADLGWDRAHSQFRLRRGRPGQAPKDTLFKLDGVQEDTQVAMLWDAVVWAANGSISVRHVLDGDAPMGAAAVVGAVPDGGIRPREPLRACKTASALALLVRGQAQDTVTIDTGDRWSTPATYPSLRGRAETLTCHGAEVAFTALRALNESGWVEGRVTQVRCKPGECAAATTELAKVFPDVKETMPTRIAAAGLDGKLLLVWQAGGIGGLRMRLASQDRIEDPADTVIYDDLVQGGVVQGTSTLLGWELFARGSFAVVLVSTTAGVHVVRIDSSGKALPLRVQWGEAAQAP